MGQTSINIKNALLYQLISLSRDGLIKAVGPADTINAQYPDASFDKVINASGMCVLPGEYLGIIDFQLRR